MFSFVFFLKKRLHLSIDVIVCLLLFQPLAREFTWSSNDAILTSSEMLSLSRNSLSFHLMPYDLSIPQIVTRVMLRTMEKSCRKACQLFCCPLDYQLYEELPSSAGNIPFGEMTSLLIHVYMFPFLSVLSQTYSGVAASM